MTSGDEGDPVLPFESVMGAFVLDCLRRFGLRGGRKALSFEDCEMLLRTALPHPPPPGYTAEEALRDFIGYLASALGHATPVSCARCGTGGELSPQALGVIVNTYRRSQEGTDAARELIDSVVKAGVIVCGWGIRGADEFLCPKHATRGSRKEAKAWSEEWSRAWIAELEREFGPS
jgi:hypothetical protein